MQFSALAGSLKLAAFAARGCGGLPHRQPTSPDGSVISIHGLNVVKGNVAGDGGSWCLRTAGES